MARCIGIDGHDQEQGRLMHSLRKGAEGGGPEESRAASEGRFLPYGRQTIERDDIDAVVAALGGDFLTTGPTVDAFEKAFAAATGANHAVACNSGTAALHLAVLALDLKAGDAAIVPSLTFLATANVVRMCGADVVFADVDPDTGLMTAETFLAALERARAAGKTVKAALPVHLNGQLCDMAALAAVADEADIALVEDACHALGVEDVGATRYSRMACFSTHPVKAIATGEGGVVTTGDAALAERMRRLRSHGMVREPADFEHHDLGFGANQPNPWYYEMNEIGWNYRMPDILCALGISQLTKLGRFFQRRNEIVAQYDRMLAPLAPALRPVPHGAHPHGWHLYAVLIDFARLGTTRSRLMQTLKSDGIGSQVHYLPVHRQPYYVRHCGEIALPGADAYYARCLSLPLFPSMTDDDVARVVVAVSAVVAPAAGLR
jgi:UDP-4-amino-4,6-dideoxy-N-acetyl-beta-L-altrosamine transaminase